MKRSAELAQLSRDHHAALEHALRLRRTTDGDVSAVVAAFLAFLLGAGRSHFDQEEALLAPAVPPERADLRRRLMRDHEEILRRATALGLRPEVEEAHAVGALLTSHVRFEERELFPLLEAHLSPGRLREISRALSRA